MIGITFNGKHSYKDYNLIMNYFKPQLPSPKKIIEDVPFMNGDGYDFSAVGTLGEIVYTGRDIPCKFTFIYKSKKELHVQYSRVAEWLLGAGKVSLVSDNSPDVRFFAEVRSVPSWDEVNAIGELEFQFRADPYKEGVTLVGEEAWDTFNFLTDFLQPNQYTINNSKTIKVYNPGRTLVPVVQCSSSMTVLNNGYTANFSPGDNKDWSFKLQSGLNILTVNGTGTIKFIFRKEVL